MILILFPGHTHEDIDQMFSVISKAMMNQVTPINTPKQFEQFLSKDVFKDSGTTIVKRVHQVLDITSYYEPHVSPYLLGLCHPSEVHWIQLHWQEEKACVEMRYKNSAVDEEWKPKHTHFDTLNMTWIPVPDEDQQGWREMLTSYPPEDSIPSALSSAVGWVDGQTPVKAAISSLTSSRFPGWKPECREEWDEFWNLLHNPTNTISWNLFSMKRNKEHNSTAQPDLPPEPQASQPVAPVEQLVAGGQDTAVGWRHWRRNRGYFERPDNELIVEAGVGDILAISPCEESREEDRQAGYDLPLSLGQVVADGHLLRLAMKAKGTKLTIDSLRAIRDELSLGEEFFKCFCAKSFQ